MKTHTTIRSLLTAAALVVATLAVLAPPAAANHSFGNCDPHNVSASSSHAPAGVWSNHAHPEWAWSVNFACVANGYHIAPSWAPGFFASTGATSATYHPTVPDGVQSVQVRTQYSYCHFHSIFTPCHTHHDGLSAWFQGPSVRVDTSAPAVWVAGISNSVERGGATFVGGGSFVTLTATDALSGVAAIHWRLDDGAWNVYTGPFAVTGADGGHVLGLRALDIAGNTGAASFALVLDTTAPAIELVTPVSNSAYVEGLSVETCQGEPRVGLDGETLAEAPAMPAAPELPEDAPEIPETPLERGPAACEGHIVKTREITVVFPGAPETPELPETPDLPVTPPGAEDLPVTPPPAPELPEGPEMPTPPTGASVEGQDASVATFIVASGVVTFRALVEDALVGTGSVSLLVDGQEVASASEGDGEYAFAWDTTAHALGQHTLTVRAVDLLGNAGELSFVVLVVSGTAPEAPEEPEVPEAPETPEIPEIPPA